MALFHKKVYVPEDIYTVKQSEKENAIRELEKRRSDINREIEEILVPYSKLVKKRSLARHKKQRSANFYTELK